MKQYAAILCVTRSLPSVCSLQYSFDGAKYFLVVDLVGTTERPEPPLERVYNYFLLGIRDRRPLGAFAAVRTGGLGFRHPSLWHQECLEPAETLPGGGFVALLEVGAECVRTFSIPLRWSKAHKIRECLGDMVVSGNAVIMHISLY
jgi:hypothetical protein